MKLVSESQLLNTRLLHYSAFVLALFLGLCATTVSAVRPKREIAPPPEKVIRYLPPSLAVPKMEKIPSIDGTIEEGEWDQAACLTGHSSMNVAKGAIWLPPENMQIWWYLGYDGKKLYIAMKTLNPSGKYPIAGVKLRDEEPGPAILWDDHLEIEICSAGRDFPHSAQGGFYKIMVNARGTVMDQWFENGTPGSENHWDMGDEVKCFADREIWTMELALPFDRINVAEPDGKSLIMHLCKAGVGGGSDLYMAWVPTHWIAWFDFGEIVLDPDAPAIQMVSTGDLGQGDIAPVFAVNAIREAPPVSVAFSVLSADDKELYRDEKKIEAQIGQRELIALKKAEVELTEGDVVGKGGGAGYNKYRVHAAYGADEQPLLTEQSPFPKMTQNVTETYVEPYLNYRESKAEWRLNVAYLPYYSRVRTEADLDFFGMDEALVRAAVKVRVSVSASNEPETIAGYEFPVTDKLGSGMFEVPDLKDGHYKVIGELLDGNGKVLSKKEVPITRKHFAWEHNRIGAQREVIPPYRPLEPARHSDMIVKTCMMEVGFGNNGLISGDNFGVLAKPFRLVGETGESKEVEPTAQLKISERSSDRWVIAADGTLGGAKYRAESEFRFDGWHQVKITLDPAGKKVDLKSLRLDIELPSWVCFMMPFNTSSLSHIGPIPKGNGLLWQSNIMPPTIREFKSYLPVLFIGDGDARGIWIKGESANGWELSDDVSCAEIHRIDTGNVILRLNLFAKPVVIEKARTIELAFIVGPNKPEPSDYRKISWGYPKEHYYHDTAGFRYYGDSVDGYALHTDADFEGLRKYIMAVAGTGIATLYGSSEMTGYGMEEFDTFAGEWLNNSVIKCFEDREDAGKTNYGGTITWTTPRQLSPGGINFTRSQLDCYVWYHEQLIRRCGLNGTWWDNGDLKVIQDYNPESGKWEKKYNSFHRYQLTQRLNRIGYDNRRQPNWIMGFAHSTWEYAQVQWIIEGPFYDIGTWMSADVFGAFTRNVPGVYRRYFPRYSSEQSMWGELGLLLLHDVGWHRDWHWHKNSCSIKGFLDTLDREIDFFNDDTHFYGYWSPAMRRSLSECPSNIYVSAYIPEPALVNGFTRRGKAMLVVWNESRDESTDAGSLTIDLKAMLGRDSLFRVRNLRNNLGCTFQNSGGKIRISDANPYHPTHLPVDPRDFLLLLLE